VTAVNDGSRDTLEVGRKYRHVCRGLNGLNRKSVAKASDQSLGLNDCMVPGSTVASAWYNSQLAHRQDVRCVCEREGAMSTVSITDRRFLANSYYQVLRYPHVQDAAITTYKWTLQQDGALSLSQTAGLQQHCVISVIHRAEYHPPNNPDLNPVNRAVGEALQNMVCLSSLRQFQVCAVQEL